jgi:hypothetical protein
VAEIRIHRRILGIMRVQNGDLLFAMCCMDGQPKADELNLVHVHALMPPFHIKPD